MNQEQLREYYQKMTRLESIESCKEMLKVYYNYFFNVTLNHNEENTGTIEEREAKLVNQMILSKTAYFEKLIDGIELSLENGKLNRITDPTVIATHTRNLYETVMMFNCVYVNPSSSDVKKVLYNLWVHAGLSYRQRFQNNAQTEDSLKKLEEEKQMLAKLKEEIENTNLYKGLDEKEQGKIQTKLKEKDYKVLIDGNTVHFKTWQELASVAGLNEVRIENIYTFFSLYAHPSNVAVFQFREMFQEEDRAFESLTLFNSKLFFFLLGVFVADYIKLFPQVIKTLESLPIQEQIAINSHNCFVRSQEYSINETWKELG